MGNCFSSNKKAKVHDREKILKSNQGKSKNSPFEEKGMLVMKKEEYKQMVIINNTMNPKNLKEKTQNTEGEKAENKETKQKNLIEENQLYVKNADPEVKQILVTAQNNSNSTTMHKATKINPNNRSQKCKVEKADLKENENIKSDPSNISNESEKVGSQDLVIILSTQEDYKEKLRLTVNYFMEEIDSDEAKEEEIKSNISALIEKHFTKLLNIFDEKRQRYKVTTKILQVIDILDAETKNGDSFYKDIYSTIKSKILPESDWRVLRKICDESENNDLILENKLTEGFMSRLKIIKNALLWKEDKIKFKLVESILNDLESKFNKDPEGFKKCLKMGRFNKINEQAKGSLIVGDEGGLYLLINSAATKSLNEGIILESGVPPEFLSEKRKVDNKIILGEGSFGKVSLALSIFGDAKVDIGQLICVKKSSKVKQKTLRKITGSVFEDFLAKKVNSSIYVPMALDMAIIKSKAKEKEYLKSYFFMEIVPQNTADKIFCDKEKPQYQKWEFQKPYCLDVMKSMKELLMNDKILNTDLKPSNTLFDIVSRKTFIIDLGSSANLESKEELEQLDLNYYEFGKTNIYSPPEILEETKRNSIKPKRVIAYLCGKTIEEITKNNDLESEEIMELQNILKGILFEDPDKRLDIEVAMEMLNRIRYDDDDVLVAFTLYIKKVRSLIETDPSALNLNSDITTTRKKGIIEQFVTRNNPRIYKYQKIESLSATYEKFFQAKNENELGLMLIFGDAGSGKKACLCKCILSKRLKNGLQKNLFLYFLIWLMK